MLSRSRRIRAAVAIGGNVSSSTINIGIPAEQLAALVRQAGDLSETQKKLIAKLEGELDLNQRQIHAALDILGEANVPPERLAAKLVEFAERFKALQATASAQPGDGPTDRSPESRCAEGHRCRRVGQSGCVARGCRDGAEARSRPPRCQRGRYLRPARRNRAYSIAVQRGRHALRQCGRRASRRGALTRTSGSATSKERRTRSTSREMNSATMALCFRLLSGTSGWSH